MHPESGNSSGQAVWGNVPTLSGILAPTPAKNMRGRRRIRRLVALSAKSRPPVTPAGWAAKVHMKGDYYDDLE